MSYLIFTKYSSEVYKIAENDFDLSTLIIPSEIYFNVNISQDDFNSVRLIKKAVLKHEGQVKLVDCTATSFNRAQLQNYINVFSKQIECFLAGQPQSIVFDKWKNFLVLLKGLNVDNIIPNENEPLKITLEQYLENQGLTSLNPLQLP